MDPIAACGCPVSIVAPCPLCDLGDLWAPCPHVPDPPRLCDDCVAALAAAGGARKSP